MFVYNSNKSILYLFFFLSLFCQKTEQKIIAMGN